MFEFRLKFHQFFFSLGSNWQYASTGSNNGLAPNRWQAIIWANADLSYKCINASRGLNELILWQILEAVIFIFSKYSVCIKMIRLNMLKKLLI